MGFLHSHVSSIIKAFYKKVSKRHYSEDLPSPAGFLPATVAVLSEELFALSESLCLF
jgi:hypothetical protein